MGARLPETVSLQLPPGSLRGLAYLLQRARDRSNDDSWLGEDERRSARQFRFDHVRDNWLLGRWTGKSALALALDLEPEQFSTLQILAADDGAPEAFVDASRLPLNLSLSHSRDFGFCMLAPAGTRMGCDLEWIEERSAAFVDTFFTGNEQQRWLQTDARQRALLATATWSAKESALKLLREGLRLDTRSVETTLPPLDCWQNWQPLSVCYTDDGTEQTFAGWCRCWNGFVLTVVSDPHSAEPVPLT